MMDFKQSVSAIADICAKKGVTQCILSPGSRSAPLTLALVRHSDIHCKIVVDERSAAFVALGIAQQTGHPVGLVCTSGTAVLNYGPAVAEAFYQHLPLLILTADRPAEWIDQNDNQTIHQQRIFANHSRGFFQLPVEDPHPDARWHTQRTISDAVNKCLWPIPGPVQINVPLREPLYPEKNFQASTEAKVIYLMRPEAKLSDSAWQELRQLWLSAKKRLILGGLHDPDTKLAAAVSQFVKADQAVVCGDVTSNIQQCGGSYFYDAIFFSNNEKMLEDLSPDLLITFGGPLVAKGLKLTLRKFRPKQHWHLQFEADAIDTYQALTKILPVSPDYFFSELKEKVLSDQPVSGKAYVDLHKRIENRAAEQVTAFLESSPLCELTAMKVILTKLPTASHLQLGNSSVVRVANFVGLGELQSIKVNSNRGTSGIDGTVSTAVGAALTTEKMTTLITGDLAFFYDRNGLWNNFLPNNLRIIVFNNSGGGIFRLLEGSRKLPELETWFATGQHLSAKATAKQHGLTYFRADSMTDMAAILDELFKPSRTPGLLEIIFDKNQNSERYLKFMSMARKIA